MKCPKCQYLGFETGDRCKNCGYDFSLLDGSSAATPAEPAMAGGAFALNVARLDVGAPLSGRDVPLHLSGLPAEPGTQDEPLPLFSLDDDRPLVSVPPTPRRPLAVRRTADLRPQTAVRPLAPLERELFDADDAPLSLREFPIPSTTPLRIETPVTTAPRVRGVPVPDTRHLVSSGPWPRMLAAGIDAGVLGGIAAVTVYFTVRMAGLETGQWRLLPLVPLTLFLSVLVFAYEGFFTALGGQTIGKMVARVRVVSIASSATGEPVGPGRAAARTAALFLSALSVGVGYLPAFIGDRRALHDRLAHTRVVDVG